MRLALLLVALLAGCGRPPASGQALSFAQKFDALARAHGRYVPTSEIAIDFPDLPPGQYERTDCANHRVSIAAGYWADLRDGYREAAVFHVLGHCLLGRHHRLGDTTAAVLISEPWSLMSPGFVPGNTYLSDVGRYVEELFAAPYLNDTVFP